MWGDDTLIAHHQWKNITEIVSGVFAERWLYLKDSAMGNTRCMEHKERKRHLKR